MAASEQPVAQKVTLDSGEALAAIRDLQAAYDALKASIGTPIRVGAGGSAPQGARPVTQHGAPASGGAVNPPPINSGAVPPSGGGQGYTPGPAAAGAGMPAAPSAAASASATASASASATSSMTINGGGGMNAAFAYLAASQVIGTASNAAVLMAQNQWSGRATHAWDFAGTGGAAIGAIAGGIAGSIIPGIGTMVGAAGGAALFGGAGEAVQAWFGGRYKSEGMNAYAASLGMTAPIARPNVLEMLTGSYPREAYAGGQEPGIRGAAALYGTMARSGFAFPGNAARAATDIFASRFPGHMDMSEQAATTLAGGLSPWTGRGVLAPFSTGMAQAIAMKSPEAGATYAWMKSPEDKAPFAAANVMGWTGELERAKDTASLAGGIGALAASQAGTLRAGGSGPMGLMTDLGRAADAFRSAAKDWEGVARNLKAAAQVDGGAAKEYVGARARAEDLRAAAVQADISMVTYYRTPGLEADYASLGANAAGAVRAGGSGAALPFLQATLERQNAEPGAIKAQAAAAVRRGVDPTLAANLARKSTAAVLAEQVGTRAAMGQYIDSPELSERYGGARHAMTMATMSPFYATNPLGAIRSMSSAAQAQLSQMQEEMNAPGLDRAARAQRQEGIWRKQEEIAGLNQMANLGWQTRIAEGALNMPSRGAGYAGSYRDALLWGHSNRRFGAASFSAADANRAGGDWIAGGSDATNRPGDAFARGMANVNITVELKDPSGTYKGQLASSGATRRAMDTDVARVTLERQ